MEPHITFGSNTIIQEVTKMTEPQILAVTRRLLPCMRQILYKFQKQKFLSMSNGQVIQVLSSLQDSVRTEAGE